MKTEDSDGVQEEQIVPKVSLGRVPIMLRSRYCVLNEEETSAADMYNFKECPLDVGGYFVVNGTEKVCWSLFHDVSFLIASWLQVIIAQERMASNNVYVFERKEAKYLFIAEIRSVAQHSSRPARYQDHLLMSFPSNSFTISAMLVKMLRGAGKGRSEMGQVIRVAIPYIKQEVPVVLVFRALGFVADRNILEHIIYDFEDQEMMELLKPSLDESFIIQEQQVFT
jgi:DNA-directed RNA polymerase II subunit RPB2